MTYKDDGGAAFPVLDNNGHALVCREFGMTLRDWFAGMALAAQEIEYETPETCANWAYQVADAMLAARSNTENKGE